MLTSDRIAERTDAPLYFNPGALDAWRDVPIFSRTWRYKWDGHKVEIEGPDGERHDTSSWTILEISEDEYKEWERDPFDQPVVTLKDVDDYIREKIMKTSMARKIGAGILR